MLPAKSRIEKHLIPLVGLPLSIARRAADMRVFHFGKVRKISGGTVGQLALHVQCPWRLEGPSGILTGRSDLWVPSQEIHTRQPDLDITKWKYDDGNLQDEKLGQLLEGYDAKTRSAINKQDRLIVKEISADDHAGAAISLSGGYRIVIFPSGSTGEAWRIFRPGDENHFVVTHEGQ